MKPRHSSGAGAALLALHERLLVGDQKARDEIAVLLLPAVGRVLAAKFRHVAVETVNDAVEDALLDYLAQPTCYRPELARLDTFVAVCASRNLIDAMRRNRRRSAAEQAVAHETAHANEAGTAHHSAEQEEARERLASRALASIARTERERAFVQVWLAGETKTSVLAAILDETLSSEKAQRRLVKQMTDRLRARARRRWPWFNWKAS